MSVDERLSTTPEAPGAGPDGPAGLGARGWLRWGWRLLTSMRTALVLLFLLALAAVPGSLLPQRSSDPAGVRQWQEDHPGAFGLVDRLSGFDVYGSPWFSAVYLLLFVSLVGCVLPRSRQHWRAMRARPPAAPRRLERLPAHAEVVVDAPPEQALAAARRVLRSRRYRVAEGDGWVSAERGYLRESGNLVFHLSLVVVLVAVAVGHLYGFRANVVVVEGRGFSNVVAQYDSVEQGPWFDDASLEPFTVSLDAFRVRYQEGGEQAGAPRDFRAEVTWTEEPGEEPRTATIASNHPLVTGRSKVFLTGNGYAPRFTVRDGAGEVVWQGASPFLPRDANNTSEGVVKVPEAQPEQLGFTGLFLPTAAIIGSPVSIFPDARDPRVFLTAFRGDLGLDDGVPQSVYRLDTAAMEQFQDPELEGQPLARALAVGETMELPDGAGSITFDGVSRFVNLQVARDPGTTPALVGAVLAMTGLLLSLFVRRRRAFVRAVAQDDGSGAGRTVVRVGGLSRSEDEGLADEVRAVADRIAGRGSR
ncbi:cytochrome c biogenesis protein ResB [Vallicoccus soli]|uniref:Cytochrome c biogenesis protein ResB n=1 Tax=Vallicoccus soli TaxID=2339232 RepID=A0A3A3Z0Y7_9ACTN|nr:cytochrome c biogenesis protein ResB [Vallicoccus soli]RJK96171.1 cytochrome c biogenesis protein ResB [Vallicoccus soli]